MRSDISGLVKAIQSKELPSSAADFFGEMWDQSASEFVSQETFVLDYKDKTPEKFSEGYGIAIVRLALAFHNTFGGVVIFGVDDNTLKPSGLAVDFDVEAFSDFVTNCTGRKIEFVCRQYTLPGSDAVVQALLVPKRENARPVSITSQLEKYSPGTVWVRDRHSARELDDSFIPLIYSDRTHLTADPTATSYASIHESIPPSPATIKTFIGRRELLSELWDWLVFDQKPRIYLHGPGGSGKSTLAHEFSRQVARQGSQVILRDGCPIDYVLYISAKESELNSLAAIEQPFALRRFEDAAGQYRAILVDSGMLSRPEVEELSGDQLTEELRHLFDTYSGLGPEA